MQSFPFSQVLFEHRNSLLELLTKNNLVRLRDFSAVDVDHDRFGIEVVGILSKRDAIRIALLLSSLFPDWPFANCYYDEEADQPAWKVAFYRHPEPPQEDWDSDPQ